MIINIWGYETSYQLQPSEYVVMQNILLSAGAVLVLAGLLFPYAKHLPLGRLPGDITIRSGDTSFFFPIVTCIMISVVVSIILNFFR